MERAWNEQLVEDAQSVHQSIKNYLRQFLGSVGVSGYGSMIVESRFAARRVRDLSYSRHTASRWGIYEDMVRSFGGLLLCQNVVLHGHIDQHVANEPGP